jgi:hypothetical protein
MRLRTHLWGEHDDMIKSSKQPRWHLHVSSTTAQEAKCGWTLMHFVDAPLHVTPLPVCGQRPHPWRNLRSYSPSRGPREQQCTQQTAQTHILDDVLDAHSLLGPEVPRESGRGYAQAVLTAKEVQLEEDKIQLLSDCSCPEGEHLLSNSHGPQHMHMTQTSTSFTSFPSDFFPMPPQHNRHTHQFSYLQGFSILTVCIWNKATVEQQ